MGCYGFTNLTYDQIVAWIDTIIDAYNEQFHPTTNIHANYAKKPPLSIASEESIWQINLTENYVVSNGSLPNIIRQLNPSILRPDYLCLREIPSDQGLQDLRAVIERWIATFNDTLGVAQGTTYSAEFSANQKTFQYFSCTFAIYRAGPDVEYYIATNLDLSYFNDFEHYNLVPVRPACKLDEISVPDVLNPITVPSGVMAPVVLGITPIVITTPESAIWAQGLKTQNIIAIPGISGLAMSGLTASRTPLVPAVPVVAATGTSVDNYSAGGYPDTIYIDIGDLIPPIADWETGGYGQPDVFPTDLQEGEPVPPYPKPPPPEGEGFTVYLTFDDGPRPGTRSILDILQRKSIKATFFMMTYDSLMIRPSEGKRKGILTLHPARKKLVEEIIAAKHLIGNHSFSHDPKMYAEPQKFLDDFIRNAEYFLSLINEIPEITKYARCPTRNTWRVDGLPDKTDGDSGAIADKLKEKKYSVYGWDAEWKSKAMLEPKDQRIPGDSQILVGSPQKLADDMLIMLRNKETRRKNKIILLTHDPIFMKPEDPKQAWNSPKQLLQLIDELQKKSPGIKFDTLSSY